MNEISPEQLLNQIRMLSQNLSAPAAPAQPPKTDFGQMLTKTLDSVNTVQKQASAMKTGFETGEGNASLAEVMIAAQKADLSFRAVTEVRNKLVQAYQDIMNMPV